MEKIFINLSNHPIANWSEKQNAAVYDLGFNKIIDLPGLMPVLDAQATATAVKNTAEEIFVRIKQINQNNSGNAIVAGAFVAGDYTLTFNLIQLLEANKIKCYSATTKRVCQEFKHEDGTIEVQRIFSFVQWRPYLCV